MQKALIVADKNTLIELNKLLDDGWSVVLTNPMSGPDFRQSVSLVVIEKKN